MRRSSAWLAVSAVFLVGLLVGSLGTHAFYAWTMRRPGGLADVGLHFAGTDLDRHLHLLPAQREQVAQILAQTHSDLEALRARTMPELIKILDEAHQRIEPLLSAEQRADFERLRQRHRDRLQRFLTAH
jgi:hypothetical protein